MGTVGTVVGGGIGVEMLGWWHWGGDSWRGGIGVVTKVRWGRWGQWGHWWGGDIGVVMSGMGTVGTVGTVVGGGVGVEMLGWRCWGDGTRVVTRVGWGQWGHWWGGGIGVVVRVGWGCWGRWWGVVLGWRCWGDGTGVATIGAVALGW